MMPSDSASWTPRVKLAPKTHWQVHAYCLIGYHFHLGLEKPLAGPGEHGGFQRNHGFGCGLMQSNQPIRSQFRH